MWGAIGQGSWQTGITVIDRCYCEKKTFTSLLDIAARESLTLRQLAEREGCGTHCGWCVAYLRRALETGQTGFDQTFPKEPLPDG